MTTISLADMARDEALAPLLRRYREAALREIAAERRPARLRLVKTIQDAMEAPAPTISADYRTVTK